MKTFLSSFFFMALVFAPFTSTAQSTKPNIIVILADDLGYGDVKPLNNNSVIPTPHFDRLAREGLTFTDAHSPSAVCTPTRYGLLCGRYPWRSRMKRGVLGGYSKPLIESDRQTMATVLKGAGYRTGCIGKWHLGVGWQWKESAPGDINNMGIAGGKAGAVDFGQPITHGPTSLGFDTSLIVPGSLDMSPYVLVRDDQVTHVPNRIVAPHRFPAFSRKGEIAKDFQMENMLDQLTREACEFITTASQQTEPFFLYFPLTAPHKPVLPHPRFRDKTDLGPYGDFITQVDWTIGEVLKTLDTQNLADNTLLIVTSDNGSFMYRAQDQKPDHTEDDSRQAFHPGNHTSNGPLRGTKADIWEAGHRVPFFVRWPQQIEGGRHIHTTICQTDILATAAEVAGQSFDPKSAEDSFSFAPLFDAQPDLQPRPDIIHQSGSGHLAIRSGPWKLILGTGSGGREKPRGKAFGEPFQLFDLKKDLSEEQNVIDQFPEIATRLHQSFKSLSHGDHVQAKKSSSKTNGR